MSEFKQDEKRLVYIAGPLTTGGMEFNIHRALDVSSKLMARDGFKNTLVLEIPHLMFFWGLQNPQDYEFWMDQCLAKLNRCDALIRLSGKSSGADREVAEANRLGIPVFMEAFHLYAKGAFGFETAHGMTFDGWMAADTHFAAALPGCDDPNRAALVANNYRDVKNYCALSTVGGVPRACRLVEGRWKFIDRL